MKNLSRDQRPPLRRRGHRWSTAVVVAAVCAALAGGAAPASAAAPTVSTAAVPDGAPESTLFEATVEGQPIGLYADTNGWGAEIAFGQFDFTGTVEVTIRVDFDFTDYEVVPVSEGIPSTRSGDEISFSLENPTNVSVVFDGDYMGNVIHLFGNAPDADVPDPADPDVIYVAPGFYDLSGGDDKIVVSSGQTLYVAPGAYLNGRVVIDGVEDVDVRGRGVITLGYQPADHPMIPLTVVDSSNVSISGVIVSRMTTGWSSTLDGASDVSFDNYKVVSPRYASTDALGIINSHDVTVTNSFLRSADDNIPIKGIASSGGYDPQVDPQTGAGVYAIDISGSQFWSDANNVITIGAETQASSFSGIRFHDNDVLFSYDDRDHHGELDERAVMSIASLNSTYFHDIVFEDIRIEQAERLISLSFVPSFWFGSLQGNLAWPGGISGVTFRNITVDGSTGSSQIRMQGWDAGRQLSDITLDNISINDSPLTGFDDSHLWINSLVSNVKIVHSEGEVTLPRGPVNVPPGDDYDIDAYDAARDYSSVQGNQGWTYQTWTAAGGAVDMQWDTELNRWRGPGQWDAIWNGAGEVYLHPDGNEVRLNWTSPRAGTVDISSVVRKFATHAGDGIRAAIWHDDTRIWPADAPWQSIAFDDAVGVAAALTAVVQEGETISFRLDQNATTDADSTAWASTIRYVDDAGTGGTETGGTEIGGTETGGTDTGDDAAGADETAPGDTAASGLAATGGSVPWQTALVGAIALAIGAATLLRARGARKSSAR